jgi:hydrogenase expression/formation protein HypD
MKYIEEFRDGAQAQKWREAIAGIATKPWTLMEVCGGQTHSIVKYGLEEMLPKGVELVHGPGCPVCVTPMEVLDAAVGIASLPEVIFCSFGDMLRIPGTGKDLLSVKAEGGDVRMVYSPLDAVKIAERHPDRQVVFFAVGFETTAPANALAVLRAKSMGLGNFSLLTSQVRVPPALEVILSSPENRIQGFLAAGHVCTVMGMGEYPAVSEKYRTPIVVTGFEPLDILQGLYFCLRQLEEGRFGVENQYARSVRPGGNPEARRMLSEVFQVVPKKWRGIGWIPESGLALNKDYADFDAERRFQVKASESEASNECISGLILRGLRKPTQCPAFGTRCTPERPLGAPMVSSEGACAAYYRYRRHPLQPAEANS